MSNSNDEVYEEDESDNEEINLVEYSITASPNDFNISTLFDFISSGVVKIPGFQRHYIWDIKRASKLIESLLIGIPIPQVFLYEAGRNNFLVIDGQQRLFTIFFFKKKRFPRKEKRVELRQIFAQNSGFPDNVLSDNEYFTDFNLSLTEKLPDQVNRFNKRNYATLDDTDKLTLDLRTIRNIIIKQNREDQGDTVIFEIFNRLNSGGVNLRPQEIRMSLYHSDFYQLLYRLNMNTKWRQMTPSIVPDLNMKDVEVILRGFAMLVKWEEYKPSLTKFLNSFSANARTFSQERIDFLERIFNEFIEVCHEIDPKIFFGANNKFNISYFEAIFVALCEPAYTAGAQGSTPVPTTTSEKVNQLKSDVEFLNASQKASSDTKNVKKRIEKAKALLL